jgi:hypothetical protein
VLAVPEEYSSWKFSGWPAVIPVPQSAAAVPGRWQAVVPFGVTFQPCAGQQGGAVDGE